MPTCREVRERFERGSDENRSFVLVRVRERQDAPKADRQENEPQPHLVSELTHRDVGMEIEWINVAVVIPEDPMRPIARELLDRYSAAVRAAAGGNHLEQLTVTVVPIPWIGFD